MKTKFFKENSDLKEAAKIIRSGGLVAMPTETVYGLAADALNGVAVKKIFEVKGRPCDNPLIVHISDFSEIYSLVSSVPGEAEKLAKSFWPGPLTIILPKSDKVPGEVTAGLNTVAVRMPSHKIARDFICLCKTPIAAPSANLSGKPSPTTFEHVVHDLDGRVDGIIDGGPCEFGVESTVITIATNPPKLLRPGGVTLEQLRSVLGEVDMDKAVLNKLQEKSIVSSPGMKYKHYAPSVRVVMVNGSSEAFVRYINDKHDNDIIALCFDEEVSMINAKTLSYGSIQNQKQQASKLFDVLREVDGYNVKCVYAHAPSPSGIGLATYNRLIRAAGFEVIKVE